MMSQLIQFCLLLATQLLVYPRPAIAYEEKVVDVPTKWQPIERYHNYNTEYVVRKITHTSGMKERKSDNPKIEATHSLGVIGKGSFFKIVELTVSYSFARKSESVTMSENEIYESKTSETTVTIPPKSTLTRWELIADVAGTKIGYCNSFDILNDTRAPTDFTSSRAKVLVPRRINYGHTIIRIKNLDKQKYITVTRTPSYSAATLGYAPNYLFVLCHDGFGTRIKTLNSTRPGFEWASSNEGAGLYFDVQRIIWFNYFYGYVYRQHWIISEDDPLHEGDVVTFKNKYVYGCFICSYGDPDSNNVNCYKTHEDRWVLETVSEGDSSINNCN